MNQLILEKVGLPQDMGWHGSAEEPSPRVLNQV
jgi:hypothetical protein